MRTLAPPLLALLLACGAITPVTPIAAAETGRADAHEAAHLFGYYPHEGARARFDAGYRAHLDWHRQRRDPLVWYGWYVVAGTRSGMFVDGSFGAPFSAFDARVDPAGDAADAARNVTAHARSAWRASYRLRRDLSTGTPLERHAPSASMQVFRYALRPGAQARFEDLARMARDAMQADDAGAPVHTWYELVVGGDAPEFLLMIAREGWAGYAAHAGGLEALAMRLEQGQRERMLAALSASVENAESEVWTYREDLSYFPPAAGD